jgi:hypothetical protein
MPHELWVESYSERSRRHAIFTDDGRTGWVYLQAPSDNPAISGIVQADAFAYSRVDPIDVQDVQSYRPSPPPIACGYASANSKCSDPHCYEWRFVWSEHGDAVVLLRNEDPWCIATPEQSRGYSKAVAIEGPWGSPWSEHVYAHRNWSAGKSISCQGTL